jgi:hypothetical protein
MRGEVETSNSIISRSFGSIDLKSCRSKRLSSAHVQFAAYDADPHSFGYTRDGLSENSFVRCLSYANTIFFKLRQRARSLEVLSIRTKILGVSLVDSEIKGVKAFWAHAIISRTGEANSLKLANFEHILDVPSTVEIS